MQGHERLVRQFRRRLGWHLLGKESLALCTVWLFVWGVVVLALRSGLGTGRLCLRRAHTKLLNLFDPART